MATYLGLDLGTTAAKGVIVSDEGQVVARARVPHSNVPDAGPGRVDPATWGRSIRAVCAELAPALAGVSAVGIATHCPVMVPLGPDGGAVGAAVTWGHPLLAESFRTRAALRTPETVRATGNHPAPSTTVALAHHVLREQDPEAFGRLRTLGFVGTWLGAQLTGAIATDPTQASYSGIYDVVGATGEWMPEAIDRLGIDPGVLPPVRSPLDVLGPAATSFAASIGLPRDVPVVVGAADTPAAVHALGYAPLISLGTTHVVSGTRSTPDLRSRVLQRRGVRPQQWLVNGVTNGGVALATAARLLGVDGRVGELIRRAGRLRHREAADAPVFVPHVTAERGPFWLERPASGLLGMDASTTPEQLAYGIVSGVILADRLVIGATLPRAGLDPLFLTGSFGEDRALPQLLADLTHRRYLVLSEPDLPAIGAAMMAAEATGGPEVPFAPVASPVDPCASDPALDAQWSRFQSLWSQVTGLDPATISQPGTASRPSFAPATTRETP